MKNIIILGIPDKHLSNLISVLERHPKVGNIKKMYTAFQFFSVYKRGSADAIFIDVTVPDKNIVEFAEKIRQIDKSVPIIGVSAHKDFVIMQNFKKKIPNSMFILKIDDNELNVKNVFEWIDSKENNRKFNFYGQISSDAKTILIVDDFENTLNIVEYTLKKNGYNVISALSVKTAIQELEKGIKPDLIISDLNMPQMNGFEFIMRVRQMTGFEKIPILILTTEFSLDKKIKAKQLKISGWIQKPYKIDEFIGIIKNTLGEN